MSATTQREPWGLTRLIVRLVAYEPGYSLAYLGVWLIVYLMELAPRLITKLFFDILTGARPLRFGVPGVIVLILLTRGFHILTIGSGAVIGARQRFGVGALLRRNLLAHILQRPGARPLPGSAGEAVNTFRDDVAEIEQAMAWLVDQAAILTYTAIALGLMVRIDAAITLLALLPLIGVILISRRVSSHAERYRKASRAATARMTGTLNEVLSAVQAIKVANAEVHVTRHVTRLGERRRQAMVRDRALSQLIIALCEEAGALTTGMILLLVADRMRTGTFTLGDFAFFVTSMDSITMFIVESGGFTAYYRQVGVAFQRLLALLRHDPPELSQAEASERLVAHNPTYLRGAPPVLVPPVRRQADRLQTLTVEGLTYHYPASDHGIEAVSFSLRRGDFVVITGRIGSGKTTLLRVLLGLLPADAGTIWWNGQPVTAPASFFVPPRSAYTAQIPHLFSASLRDNILMGYPATPADLQRALRMAALEPDLARMPEGLDTVIGPRGVRLSGGQRLRTAAARMFVRQPELLVIDDLSSALDVETERMLWDNILARTRVDDGTTVLAVSHRRPALQRADTILLLQEGHLAASGPLEALLESNEEMRQIWGDT